MLGVLAAAVALIVFPALSGADATNPPVVTTDPATVVTNTSAKLNGTVDPNDPDNGASYTFSWGQTTAYGTNVNGTTSPGTTAQSVSTTLSGLAPATTYHYMLCATNAPEPARRHDVRRRSVLHHARCARGCRRRRDRRHGERSDPRRDGQPERRHGTSAVFKYGTGCSAPAWTTGCSSVSASPSPGSGRSPVSVSATLSGLAAGATFHYTLCATNTYGTNCDTTDHTFVTNIRRRRC